MEFRVGPPSAKEERGQEGVYTKDDENMAIWSNQPEPMRKMINKALKVLMRKNKRKKKIDNVLRARS
jgi:hypothetical protein